MLMRFGSDRCAEREAVDDRVQCQAESESDPTELVRAGDLGGLRRGGIKVLSTIRKTRGWVVVMAMIVVVFVAALFPFDVGVGMDVEDADEQEHAKHAAERPISRTIH